MKRIIVLLYAGLAAAPSLIAQVAINNDASLPHPSAMLDIKNTGKGLLTPRMTTAQRNAIASPATGLMVYDTDVNKFFFYAAGSWIEMGTGSATNYWTQNGNNIYNNNPGNVGIGTNTPARPLHIYNTSTDELIRLQGVNPYILLGNLAGSFKSFFQSYNDHLLVGTATGNLNGEIRFYNNNALNMVVLPIGNVGIGTNNPQAPLHISHPAANELMKLQGNTPYIGFYNIAGTYKGFLWQGPGDDVSLATAIGNTTGAVRFYNNNSNNMSIHPNGNVGIGMTSSPPFKLSVVTGTNTHGISHSDGTVILSTYIGSGGGWLGTWTNHPLHFYTNNGGQQMTLLQNGNVGIGTSTPVYKLAVNGTIRSKEVIVETDWADYVFEKNYRLMPIDELEKFIRQKKHLPNVPSAKDVAENGLHVGEVQKKMMEKIEELALYIIELKKEIELLKENKQ